MQKYKYTPRDPLDLKQLSGELRLLLTVVQASLGLADTAQVTACLQEDLHWPTVLQIGEWHRLHLMLFKVLHSLNHPGIPATVMRDLERGYRGNGERNLKLTSLLFKLLGCFNEANIPVLVIKGLALAGPLYEDNVLRRSGDLDLLVKKKHVPRAMELICAQEGCETPPMSPFPLSVLMRTDSELKLYFNGELVELQWRLGAMESTYSVKEDELFEEAANVSLADRGLPTLSPLELLPYLCFHGTKHMWYRFFWLIDVAALLQKQATWDWDAVFERAQERGHLRSLLLGLALANHLLACPLPDRIHQTIEAMPEIGKRVQQLCKFLLNTSHMPYISNQRFLTNVWWMQPQWHMRIASGWRYFFQPTIHDLRALPLPRFLAPLYYLTRPFRLGLLVLRPNKPKQDRQ